MEEPQKATRSTLSRSGRRLNPAVHIALISVLPALITSILAVYATLFGASERISDLQGSVAKAEKNIGNLEQLPIGAVVAWWGNWTDEKIRPTGFELCDGSAVQTVSSPIFRKPKPDLRSRVIMGASADRFDMVGNPVSGGKAFQENLVTEAVQLSIDQMPRHDHGGTTAKDGSHSHDTRGKSASDDGGQGSDSHFALGDHKDDREWPGIEVLSKGSEHSHRIEKEGKGESHSHKIPEFDNRPPFLELLYIIRVE